MQHKSPHTYKQDGFKAASDPLLNRPVRTLDFGPKQLNLLEILGLLEWTQVECFPGCRVLLLQL